MLDIVGCCRPRIDAALGAPQGLVEAVELLDRLIDGSSFVRGQGNFRT
jgi:hypothetical protein